MHPHLDSCGIPFADSLTSFLILQFERTVEESISEVGLLLTVHLLNQCAYYIMPPDMELVELPCLF